MGKEWHWAGRSFKRGGAAGGETPSGCMCAVFQFFDFQPFHFSIQHQHQHQHQHQQQQPSFNPSSCIPEDHPVPKGVEAPRNSLESEDDTMSSVSKEEILKMPIQKSMQIKTSRSTRAKLGNVNDLSAEISSSPGTKTPTLVARLMGLDLLPDAQSPSSSSCFSTPNPQGNPHVHHLRPRQHIQTKPRHSTDSDIVVSRSLPETPRISSARRSDVEHRLSLQINKENMGLGEELELPRFSFSKRKFEEHSTRSRSHYARQIVKQVKESVSRKVWLDITNTVKNREQARVEFVGQYRSNKSTKTSLKVPDESSPGKLSNPSCSPRLRFMDAKNKPSTATTPLIPKDQNSHPAKLPSSPPVNTQPHFSRLLTKPKPQALPEQELQKQKSVPKCKKAANERFSPRLKKPPQTSDIIRNKQEESFVRPLSPTRANDIKSKSKKSRPLSSNLLHLKTVPNLLPVKADPSPPTTKISQKQVSDTPEPKRTSQLSSGSRQTYKQKARCILGTRESNDEDKSNGASTTIRADGPEFQYVKGILSRTRLVKGTTVSFSKWFSPSHPLDPSIFHHLEQYPTSTSTVSTINHVQDSIFTWNNHLGLRCNRRLLFDLVDEILLEILGQGGNLYNNNGIQGSQLIEKVCKKIGRFPSANCQVLEDIDALIEIEDMPKMKVEGAEALEEEGKGLVAEIEGNIMDTLVHETVMECGGSVREGRRRLRGSREET